MDDTPDLGHLLEPISGRHCAPDEARERIACRARLFIEAGAGPGSVVFLHAANCIEFFIDLCALWRLGACAAPIDARLTAFELARLAEAARPVASVWQELPPEPLRSALADRGVRLLSTLDEPASATLLPGAGAADHDQAALLMFTSGTTGDPKGVLHSHAALRARWARLRASLDPRSFERTLCVVPTCFSFGLGAALLPWLHGQTVLLLPPFRQDLNVRLGELCDAHEATCVAAVPAQWRIATRMSRPPQRGSLRLVASGTAPMTAALAAPVMRWARAPVADIYGMTETGWIAASLFEPEGSSSDDASRPLGLEVLILPHGLTDLGVDAASACAVDEIGHVWLRSDSLLSGYLRRDDLTREALRDGWFCTGDLGCLDVGGRLHLHGRHKELINVGGSKIYPADLDAVAAAHPLVEDACAFAVEDPLLGEAPALALVLREPGAAGCSQVLALLSTRLAEHQLPRRWYLLDAVPRNARGKPDRAATARACASLPSIDTRQLRKGSIIAA